MIFFTIVLYFMSTIGFMSIGIFVNRRTLNIWEPHEKLEISEIYFSLIWPFVVASIIVYGIFYCIGYVLQIILSHTLFRTTKQ